MPSTATSSLAANLAAHRARWGFAPDLVAQPAEDIRVETVTAWPRVSLRAADGAWRRVHSDRQPIDEARRWIANDPGAPLTASLVCLVGGGEGYVLDVLAQEARPTTKILLLEPVPALLMRALERRDWTALIESGRLMILSGPAYVGRAEAWRLVTPRANDTSILRHPVIAEARPDEAREAVSVIRQALAGAAANEEARERFAGRYLLNTLRHLPVLASARDVRSLFDSQRGRPAIIAAAGPSLNRNLLELSLIDRWRERATFIAVDTALKPALAAGLAPHYVVAVDPGEMNARKLADLAATSETALIAEPSLHTGSFDAFAGRTFLFKVSDTHHPWPWVNSQGHDVGKLRAWGSVLTTALDFALRLGCDPIVFIGADLAYTNGQPHSRNTIYEKEWTEAMAHGATSAVVWQYQLPNSVPAIDLAGRPTRSSEPLIAFRDWIVAQTTEETQRRFVNATGCGILFGPAITEASLASALGEALPGPLPLGAQGSIRAVPLASHALLDAARVLLDRSSAAAAPTQPIADWLEFARGTVSPADLLAALAVGTPQAPPLVAGTTALTTLSPKLPSAADWREERRYWRARLAEIYASRYGITTFHPLQDSDAVVPPRELVNLVQSPHMGTPDGFWGSSFRGACLYLDELHDHGFDPRDLRRVLDFGVGLGRLLVNYLPFGLELTGCDVTPDVVPHTARLFGEQATIVPTDVAPPLPFADGTFDFVYANSVFTHILGAQQPGWIGELARVTRPGGCVIATAIDLNVHYGGPPAQLDALLQPRGWFELEPEAGVKRGFLASDTTLHALWSEHFQVREIRHHFTEQSHLICTKA